MTNKIKHVFFDLDHTLWDFDKNSGLTFETIFKLHGIDVDLDEFLDIYVPINFNYWKLFREAKVTKEALRYGRLKDAFDALNIEVTDKLIDDLSESYIEHLSSHNHLFEGALDILDYLNQKYQLHIITNGFNEVQGKKMKNSKLMPYFETVTDSESAGVKKPNPIIFNYALKQANARPTDSLMVGDSLEADVQGAIDVGMSAIHFNYNHSQIETEHTQIFHLSALKDIL